MVNPVKAAGEKTGVISGLIQNARLALRLVRDQRMPTATKLLIPGLAVAYFLLPVDLVPDFLPGLGQLDDLAVIALGLKLFVDMSPSWLVQWHRDTMAGRTPKAESPRKEATVDGEYRIVD